MIRPGGARDVPFLRDMLRHAFYWRTPVGDEEPPLTRYVRDWGRPGDRSLIAIDEFLPVGGAWYRLFTPEEAGFGFIDEKTPELAIAVVPSRRGRGYGHELLSGLLDYARKDGFEARALMTLTLTCDHRSLDGATASDFLRTVKAFLEEPGLML